MMESEEIVNEPTNSIKDANEQLEEEVTSQVPATAETVEESVNSNQEEDQLEQHDASEFVVIEEEKDVTVVDEPAKSLENPKEDDKVAAVDEPTNSQVEQSTEEEIVVVQNKDEKEVLLGEPVKPEVEQPTEQAAIDENPTKEVKVEKEEVVGEPVKSELEQPTEEDIVIVQKEVEKVIVDEPVKEIEQSKEEKESIMKTHHDSSNQITEDPVLENNNNNSNNNSDNSNNNIKISTVNKSNSNNNITSEEESIEEEEESVEEEDNINVNNNNNSNGLVRLRKKTTTVIESSDDNIVVNNNNNNNNNNISTVNNNNNNNNNSNIPKLAKMVVSSDSESEQSNLSDTLIGVCADGTRFPLPYTKNPLTLHPINEWSFFDYAKNASLASLLLLFLNLPGWFFIGWFLFWRFAYNIGLGLILRYQSNTNFLTKIFRKISKPDHPLYSHVKQFCTSGMGSDYDFDKTPAEYNAWLAYRHVVDIVLANDLVTYVVFAMAYYEFPKDYSWTIIPCYLLGVFLCAFTFWAKTDAYRVVKDFAWYWGDFFFLVDQKLTFDRVFSISPHPMYTIGYTFYYGLSLISQSYTVLYVSLFAHFCQLLFLVLVEDPHIQKTYPEIAEDPHITREKVKTYFGHDLVVVKNFHYFRAADFFTLLIALYTLSLNLFNIPTWFYIIQAIFWRCMLSFGLGLVLRLQSTCQWWTNKYQIDLGKDKYIAFENWKNIYNLCLIMAHISFTSCFFKYAQIDFNFFGSIFWRQILGLMLILINLWSSFSTFEVLGEFGWFYGDFFIEEVPSNLYYTGIYRFLNNPDSTTGFAGFYGLSLIAGSFPLFALSIFSQVANFLFIKYVEQPHMKKLYGSKIRSQSGISKGIQEIVNELTETSPPIQKLVSKTRVLTERVEKRVTERLNSFLDELADRGVPLSLEQIEILKTLKVKYNNNNNNNNNSNNQSSSNNSKKSIKK